jgi:deoxyribose-phosphate aldolase
VKLSAHDAAQLIDISAVQAYHGKEEIEDLVSVAKKYSFKAVHVLPSWVTYLKGLLADSEEILIGAPVGFPSGGNKTEVKVIEAKHLVDDGAQELDMMINVGKLRSGQYEVVLDDVKRVIDTIHPLPVKVILETHYLTHDEIKKGCEICIEAGADFVKTSTGWAETGATLEVVKLITSFVGDSIQVKAAGGVRGVDAFVEMYKLGVTRFGINAQASMDLIDEINTRTGGEIEIE